MAVGITNVQQLKPIAGIKLASVASGIKKNKQDDLVLITLSENSQCVASFTQNAFCAAPVVVAKNHISSASTRALIINSGNANAGTGANGLKNAEQSCYQLAQQLNCKVEQVLPFSTGVIGQQLPMNAVVQGIQQGVNQLGETHWLAAAKGIMTTDTVTKGYTQQLQLAGQKISISAIAKGSGMINPDMATLLAFIATDANVDKNFLQNCLNQAIENSFNAISVDGDTSTNDACVLIATGKADNKTLHQDSDDAQKFAAAIKKTCIKLAQSIVRDGEGATKFVTIQVDSAQTLEEAKIVAKTIAHSPLVKTALFASDANWGRILAAVGRAEITQLDIAKVSIYLDDVCIISAGEVDKNYTEEKGQAVMAQAEIKITVDLGRGAEKTTLWTTDLSHEYIRINAEYRS